VKRVPDSGIEGEAALKEAATTELGEVMNLVRAALLATIYPGESDRYVAVEAFYPDRVVARKDGRLFAYPYQLNAENQVVLGAPEEVVVQHEPVRMAEAQGAFLEAVGEKPGLRYRVRVVRAGVSANGNYYTDAVLREAAPMFNGCRVFVKSDAEHIREQGKDFSKLIGRLVEAQFLPGGAVNQGELQATLELLESAAPVPQKIHEAYTRGMARDLFGFSIDANAQIKRSVIGGKAVREPTKLTKINSLDLIIEPAAGGEIISLLEATHREERTDMKHRDIILAALAEANGGNLPAGLNLDDDAAIEASLLEAVQRGRPGAAPAGVTQAQLDQAVRLVEARSDLRVTVAKSGLPERAQSRVLEAFAARDSFSVEDVQESIRTEREYVASFQGGGQVAGLGDGSLIEAGEDFADKMNAMLDAFFAGTDRNVRSIKECYIQYTGDRQVTGELAHCDRRRLREAAGSLLESVDSSTWANALGTSMRRALLADYANTSRYDVWRLLSGMPVPAQDFRTNERTRVGGYGDLPAVAQGDPYGSLASPSDEKASYAVTKRGGTEDVTLETIKNDDVGAVQRIPMKLSRAAKRTLSKFVLDFLATNPAIYDGDALFHANHGNLGSTALSAATLAAARLATLKQTELTSADRIGIPLVNLWLPPDLEETGFDLFRRTTNNDTDFVESLQMKVIPVWYWTDANNWFSTCDPNEIPIVEVAFLDGNEEPEIFVQDHPTVGSLFTHDKITYKIRHVYGGNVVEYRGAYGAIVA
jgi:hypothetical protein